MPLDKSTCFLQRDGLEITEVPDGYVVYQAGTERVHYLNATAAIIFELCDGNHSVSEIVEVLETEFSLDQQLQGPVTLCLQRLVKQGLIA